MRPRFQGRGAAAASGVGDVGDQAGGRAAEAGLQRPEGRGLRRQHRQEDGQRPAERPAAGAAAAVGGGQEEVEADVGEEGVVCDQERLRRGAAKRAVRARRQAVAPLVV